MTTPEIIYHRDKLIELLQEQFDRYKISVPFTHLYKMAGDLVLDGVTAQSWIPVTEGLPTAWQIASDDEHAGEPLEFIVFIDGAEIPTTLYFNGTWFIDNCGEPYPVTHWMPMPEPPKED